MIRMTVLGILCWVHAAAAGTHSLQYFAVVTSDETKIPNYVAVNMVDDVQYSSYDSTMDKPVLLLDWMNKTKGREFWERRTWHILTGHDIMKWSLRDTIQHFNHTGGVTLTLAPTPRDVLAVVQEVTTLLEKQAFTTADTSNRRTYI